MLKKILIFAATFFVLALGLVSYKIFYSSPTQGAPELSTANENQNVFGQGATNSNQNQNNQTNNQVNDDLKTEYTPVKVTTLTELTTEPVAGATLIQSGTSTIVRYNERATNHVYDINLISGSVTRISNITIPIIYESIWSNSGSNVIIRYIRETSNTVATYGQTLTKPKVASTTNSFFEVRGVFLPDNIETLAVSPSSKKIFYLTLTPTGTEGVVVNPDNTKPVKVFNSPISEWVSEWPKDNTLTLTTKASSGTYGYLYFVDATKGSQRGILINIPGLTTRTNPQATRVIYSDNTAKLAVVDLEAKSAKELGINTLAEKCVWSVKEKGIAYCFAPIRLPQARYPDDWYQGLVSFSDGIFRVNTTTGQATLVANLEYLYGQSIDAINPVLSSSEDFVVFQNKNNLHLWSYRLK